VNWSVFTERLFPSLEEIFFTPEMRYGKSSCFTERNDEPISTETADRKRLRIYFENPPVEGNNAMTVSCDGAIALIKSGRFSQLIMLQ